MPDDQSVFRRESAPDSLKQIIPPVLMAFGAISLLRTSRFLSLLALGAFLYDGAVTSDAGRKSRGRDPDSKRQASLLLDREIEDSFPASDPPSSSGNTVGAP